MEWMRATDDSDCPQLNKVGEVVLGSVLTVGIFASYIPQHVSIIRSKTSEGLSLFMLLLSNVSSLSIVLFSVMDQWDLYSCCTRVGFAQCQRILLELYQLLVGLVNLGPMYALAIWYHPGGPRHLKYNSSGILDVVNPASTSFSSSSSSSSSSCTSPSSSSSSSSFSSSSSSSTSNPPPHHHQHRLSLEADQLAMQNARRAYIRDAIVFLVYNLIAVVLIIVSLVLTQSRGPASTGVETFHDVLGFVAIASTFLIWLPQIYEVYQYKGSGSLSVLMLLLQAPGALAVTIYQGFLQHEAWGVWVPYLAVFVQECIILGQLGWYWWQDRQRRSVRPAEMLSLLSLGDDHEDSSPDTEEEEDHFLHRRQKSPPPSSPPPLAHSDPDHPDDDIYSSMFDDD